jgi:hypothetical protein
MFNKIDLEHNDLINPRTFQTYFIIRAVELGVRVMDLVKMYQLQLQPRYKILNRY